MTTLILTVVGSDRPGLVATVAHIVGEHGGNWENSRLAELAGTFAGVIQVSVPVDRVEELRASLHGLDGLMTIAVHPGTGTGSAAVAAHAGEHRLISVQVLGNDRPGIVREISAVLNAHALSIESMTSETRDAAMAGGRLFEASVVATVPAAADPAALRADLERIANDLQVDITID
ncbi:glycine cleavage system protein R [Microbacterium sp. 22242]|uniref:glycine cleavage system protein R n=1 Tax=Microbacterium sp. 22242 TaxID=3453896 RepID=UPI003F84FDE6